MRSQNYRFPPGLEYNLIWYAFRRFRPGDPIALFQFLTEKFGDAVHYKIGPKHIVFLNDPALIREVLVVQNDNFTKERTVRRTKMLLGEGMITSEGNLHRVQRLTAQPAFHRQRIQQYADVVIEETSRVSDSWRNGETLDIAQQMMHLTLRIVARTLFNTELGDGVRELVDAINRIMRLYNYLVALPAVEALIHLRVPGLAEFTGAKKKLDDVVARMIENHRRSEREHGDLLDMMLQSTEPWSDEMLRDQVITIFLAGFETVANALTWTFYLLSENPEAGEKLSLELDQVLAGRIPTVADISPLRYTEMVLAESMRLYPPAWAMGRLAREDFDLGPYRLPAGTTILASQFITQRDGRHFPDPLSFDPDRFAPAGKATFPKFVYFPFGAGARQCIGESLAWMESSLMLTVIAQKWRLHLVPGHKVEPQALITLRPKFGMKMKVAKREIQQRQKSA
jgi:cytochrome P450